MNNPRGYKPSRLSVYKQWIVTTLLIVVLAVTRSEYLPYLPDASWAIFFLIGFYLRSYLGLIVIILAALMIDFAVISAKGGHQDFYLSPSYLFIIPAYSALWFAGRFFANHYSVSIKGFLIFIGSAITGTVVCDVISSGGFYWISTDFVELSHQELIRRTFEYLPISLITTLLHLGIAAVIHLTFVQISKLRNPAKIRNN